MSLGANGTLLVADVNSLRRVSMPEDPTTVLGVGFDGRVTTVAGSAGSGEADGTGPEVIPLQSDALGCAFYLFCWVVSDCRRILCVVYFTQKGRLFEGCILRYMCSIHPGDQTTVIARLFM